MQNNMRHTTGIGRRVTYVLALAASVLLLAGCASPGRAPTPQASETQPVLYKALHELDDHDPRDMDQALVTSFVDYTTQDAGKVRGRLFLNLAGYLASN